MENNTVTQMETNKDTKVSEHEEKSIKTPLLILFAEYLGYVSRFNDIAFEWCEGKVPDKYIQSILNVEAKTIFRQMKKDYTMEEIQY
jgi:hypothetical protein